MRQLLVILLVIVASGCANSPDSASSENTAREGSAGKTAGPSGRILRAGIFSKVSGGNIIESPDTTTGKALSKLVMTFIKEAERIPIKKDTIIGYQYRLSNLPDVPVVQLRRVLRHPPFTLPDGSVTTGSDYTIRKKAERNEVFAYDVYALNENYEMVEGEWIFQIWYQDKMLLERKFTTYIEEAAKPSNGAPARDP